MRKNSLVYVFVLGITCSLVVSLLSCATSSGVKGGYSDFSGFVVDENDMPVKDYVLTCKSGVKDFGSAVTNESGFFFFEKLPPCQLNIRGWKDEYTEINNLRIDFKANAQVYKVNVISAKGVLDIAAKSAELHKSEEALPYLKSVRLRTDSPYKKVFDSLIVNLEEIKRTKEYIKSLQ